MTDLAASFVQNEDIIVPAQIVTRIHLKDGDQPPSLFISENDRYDVQVQAFVRKITDKDPDTFIKFLPLNEIHALNKGGKLATDMQLTPSQKKVVELFRLAVNRKASDIHIAIGEEGLAFINLRIHGSLIRVNSIPQQEGLTLASTIILSMCDVAESQFNSNRPQDGRIESKYLEGLNLFGARYSHTPTVHGIHVVMRLIPDDSENPPTLSELGFLPEQQKLLEKMLVTPEGMVILSGPTGSGKSSTLRTMASMYLTFHEYALNLVTYEDPPEGRIKGAVQCPIIANKNNPDDVLRAWRLYLANTLRIDPDAILIGEMRDSFSAQACVTNAMTGHLVLSTTHANDPFNILERLLTLDIRPELLTDPQLFIGLVSQRLVPVLCEHCKLSWNDVVNDLSEIQQQLISKTCDTGTTRFRNPAGCSCCEEGIVGRQVVAEVIHPDAQFMLSFRKQGKLAAREYWIKRMGGITRNAHVLKLVNQGLVDPRSAQRICPLDEDRRLLTEGAQQNES
ncbi:type II secretion protein E (plasmid) [Pectobacterium parmentieri]|uniref:GspE/PulE family protein n=1 Tax=Pectobacterium parmentieri TaxID=1905730 RepID=UPI000F8E288E|nr:ATPase, T2SS/T4P/T4SS family [Pectobacterium parmentieri]AZS59335.1 type II secretion protein E [Pectobacterium parmentieri]